jgi:hypothetical protein
MISVSRLPHEPWGWIRASCSLGDSWPVGSWEVGKIVSENRPFGGVVKTLSRNVLKCFEKFRKSAYM